VAYLNAAEPSGGADVEFVAGADDQIVAVHVVIDTPPL
jgi:hypothetical protein